MSLNDIGHVNSRVQTDLAANEIFGDTETDLNVVSTSRFQAPCAVLIGHRDAWHDPTITYAPEIIWVTEVPSGTVLRTTLANRGQSGTAARTHDNAAGDLVATLIFDQRNWEHVADELLIRAKIADGSYTGDGTSSRIIDIGFAPRHVQIVGRSSGQRHWSNVFGGTAGHFQGSDNSLQSRISDEVRPRLRPEGFVVAGDGAGRINNNGETFDWVAWG